jgi:hypothetical protein
MIINKNPKTDATAWLAQLGGPNSPGNICFNNMHSVISVNARSAELAKVQAAQMQTREGAKIWSKNSLPRVEATRVLIRNGSPNCNASSKPKEGISPPLGDNLRRILRICTVLK